MTLLVVHPAVHVLLQALVLLVLGGLSVFGGKHVVLAVFRRVDRRAAAAAPHPEEAQADQPARGVIAAGGQLRGGTWIGRLERLAIFAGLVAHYPEAIAICLALKGLARYPELKATTTGAAERFIIGTFVSVLVACAGAGLALWINRVLVP